MWFLCKIEILRAAELLDLRAQTRFWNAPLASPLYEATTHVKNTEIFPGGVA